VPPHRRRRLVEAVDLVRLEVVNENFVGELADDEPFATYLRMCILTAQLFLPPSSGARSVIAE
jgi:hypothetical protein